MAKNIKPTKVSGKANSKKLLLESVEKHLEEVLSKIDADMEKKEMRKKIKQAGKILLKGFKVKKAEVKKTVTPVVA